MRLLLVHQNAPAQYKHIIQRLVDEGGHEVVVLSQPNERPIPGARRVFYTPPAETVPAHRYLRGTTAGLGCAEAVLQTARTLKAEGFTPDVMLGHNAWGETLFLKDVWPDAPLLGYFEFFYHARGADTGFDPEFPGNLDDFPRTRVLNTINLLGLDAADWGHSATRWQRSRYPAVYRPRITAVHEGIDTAHIRPNPGRALALPDGTVVRAGEEVVTYISRSLETYRGFHSFMRALPDIQRRRPNARILVVGKDDVSYGPRLAGGQTFRQALLEEQKGRIDLERIHFLGWVPYEVHLAILQVSAVHIYLTYPFVLSWSMLEAMASGCAIVGSATPPVMEVIQDGHNGLLVDFFSPRAIAERVEEVLSHPSRMAEMRQRARQTVLDRYDLESVCLPRLRGLIGDLAEGRRPAPDAEEAPAAEAVPVDQAVAVAVQAAKAGQVRQAEDILRAVVTQRPGRIDALGNLAGLLAGTGRMAEAEEYYRRALHLAPDEVVLRQGLARCLAALSSSNGTDIR